MLGSKIQNLRLENQNNLNKTIVMVMKEMGWSFEQLNNTPIPSFFEIVSELNNETKRQKKLSKRKK